MRFEVIGAYPVPEAETPCHLVEALVWSEREGEMLDFGQVTQEIPGEPRENWQVPWDERKLDPEGTASREIEFGQPFALASSSSPTRIAFFFHLLNFRRPLMTPAGPVALPPEQPRPKRLAFLRYQPPC
jgi:hypothetical protein